MRILIYATDSFKTWEEKAQARRLFMTIDLS